MHKKFNVSWISIIGTTKHIHFGTPWVEYGVGDFEKFEISRVCVHCELSSGL